MSATLKLVLTDYWFEEVGIWILILFLSVMLICGITDPQYKFFALGGLSTLGYLIVLSFFK